MQDLKNNHYPPLSQMFLNLAFTRRGKPRRAMKAARNAFISFPVRKTDSAGKGSEIEPYGLLIFNSRSLFQHNVPPSLYTRVFLEYLFLEK